MYAQLLFIVLATLHGGVVDQRKEKNPIVPDTTIQSRIERSVNAATKSGATTLEQLTEAEKQLRNLREKNPEVLVQQILYYCCRNTERHDEKRAWTSMLIMDYFRIPERDYVNAVTPYIDTDNKALRREVRRILRGIDGSSRTTRYPDYSYYTGFIRRNKQAPPSQLVQYMYERAPGQALLTLLGIYTKRTQKIYKEVLWAERVIANTLWKQRKGFIGKHETEPDAIVQLGKLSRSKHWWTRLYVAQIMRQHRGFRQPEIIERLKKDDHPLVHKAMQFDDKDASQ